MSERDKRKEEECSSQENVKKKKKTLPRTEDEVLEVLQSWRDKNKNKSDGDTNSNEVFSDAQENMEQLDASINVIKTPEVDEESRVYAVIYGKNKPYKKHKTFEFDGTLIIKGSTAILKDCDGLVVTRGSEYKNNELDLLKDGSHLVVGDQLCEICYIDN